MSSCQHRTDLDSLASCIAYSYIQTVFNDKPTVSMIPYPHEDMRLRAENLHALKSAGIMDSHKDLLFYPDLKTAHGKVPCRRFALVDHNRLGHQFEEEGPYEVVAVIDHHEDEGLYQDTANPRHIAPAGSCISQVISSLLLQGGQDATVNTIPRELATLLLSAILIDTSGLSAKGKAIAVDRQAAEYLLPQAALSEDLQWSSIASSGEDRVAQLSRTLSDLKGEVSHLSPRDLLRRDYKEYSFQPPWLASSVKAGLSTVPRKLQTWGSDGQLLESARRWMEERGLNVLGVLAVYTHDDGKGRRQMAWFVAEKDSSVVDMISSRLWKGLEEDEFLQAQPHEFDRIGDNIRHGDLQSKTYKQNNRKATRKAVAPLLKAIMESN